MNGNFRKDYRVAIDTVPMPESPSDRIELVMKGISPVINQIVRDAMSVAIGTWPTPEQPKMKIHPGNLRLREYVPSEFYCPNFI